MSNELQALKNSPDLDDSSSTLDKIASSFTGYQNKKVKTQMSKL